MPWGEQRTYTGDPRSKDVDGGCHVQGDDKEGEIGMEGKY